jgi:hypothetical protein
MLGKLYLKIMLELLLWVLGTAAAYFVGGLLYLIWLMNKHL